MSNLFDGETYYWKVVPISDGLEGPCLSGVWSLKVDMNAPDPAPIYKIGISGPDSAVLFQGENKSLFLSITNLGLTDDLIELEIHSQVLGSFTLLNDYKPLKLNSKESGDRIIIITAPSKLRPGIYELNVTAVSLNSGENIKAYHIINVEIKEKESDGISKEPSWFESNQIVLYLLMIIIVIIIIITALLFRKKRTNEEVSSKDVAPTPGTFVTRPGALATPSIEMEQFAGQNQTEHLPQVTGIGSQTAYNTATQQMYSDVPMAPKSSPQPSPQGIMPPRPQLPPSPDQDVSTDTNLTQTASQVSPLGRPQYIDISKESTKSEKVDEMFSFGIDGGPKPFQKEVVKHDVTDIKAEEVPDMDKVTEDLKNAGLVKTTDENTVMHEGDKGIWKPNDRGKKKDIP